MDIVRDAIEIRRQTGVLTETPSLYEALTARENLRFVGEIHNIPPKRLAARIDELLEQFGLENRADEPVGAFSRGMKQRLAIARALMLTPDLLLLDEPSIGLAPLLVKEIMKTLSQISREMGSSIFVVEQNVREIFQIAHKAYILKVGRIVREDTNPMLLLQDENLQKSYLT